jgi:hypothetical protein
MTGAVMDVVMAAAIKGIWSNIEVICGVYGGDIANVGRI